MQPSQHVIHLCLLLAVSCFAAPSGVALEKFEPPEGCYLGAYIEQDPVTNGDIAAFEALTGKKHASYFKYVGYGRPFPTEWVEKVKAAGAVPQIAWEPNDGLAVVRDDTYLRQWARAARAAACPVFLRYASEMNGTWMAYSGNPPLYIAKFRLVHDVMAQEAPNVAMVWAPFATPQATIPVYYPGDAYVDWVGVNIYSVVHHNANPNEPGGEDPCKLLRFVYDLYASRKPIQISEYGATHFCAATKLNATQFGVRYMTRLYEALPREFPRVKMIYYFCVDAARRGLAHNDYSFTDDPAMLRAYRRLITSPYYLSQPPDLSDIPPELLKPVRPWSATELSGAGADGIRVVIQGSTSEGALTGTVRVSVQTEETQDVAAVAMYVDESMLGLTNVRPFSLDWDTRRVENGEHHLRIVIFDRSMREAAVRESVVKVAN